MPIPSTQYAQTSDGVHIAYWVTGSGPPLIVLPYNPNISWLAEQKIEEARQYFERLAQSYTVIALDSRGTGIDLPPIVVPVVKLVPGPSGLPRRWGGEIGSPAFLARGGDIRARCGAGSGCTPAASPR